MKKMILRMFVGLGLVLAFPSLVDVLIPYIALVLVLNDLIQSLL